MNNLPIIPYSRLGLSIVLGLLLTWLTIAAVYAQKPGDLDTTFNGAGIVTTTLGSPWEWGLGVAIQADDKIVVVGERAGHNGVNFIVLRYTVTGTLDTTFNDTGFITTALGDYASAFDVVIQPDGKIVAAGFSGIGHEYGPPGYSFWDYTIAVARYTVTGTLDATFNGTGIVTTSISNENAPYDRNDQALSVALQPHGEIVVAGYAGHNDHHGNCDCDFAVVRYTPTGTLDSTFNGTGIVTTPIGQGDDQGGAVAVQPDGKIVVAGYSENDVSDADFAIVRYTTTGDLDADFNHTGIVTTPISSGYDRPYALVIQPDGKLVVSGFSYGWGSDNGDFAVARYTITGSLDTTFNQTGVVTTSLGPDQEGYKLALQPDGKLVVAGYSENGADDTEFTVIRYTASGALDTSFNNTGVVTTPIGSDRIDTAVDVALQSDGKIVVVGIDGEGTNINNRDDNIVVVRYLNSWGYHLFLPILLKE